MADGINNLNNVLTFLEKINNKPSNIRLQQRSGEENQRKCESHNESEFRGNQMQINLESVNVAHMQPAEQLEFSYTRADPPSQGSEEYYGNDRKKRKVLEDTTALEDSHEPDWTKLNDITPEALIKLACIMRNPRLVREIRQLAQQQADFEHKAFLSRSVRIKNMTVSSSKGTGWKNNEKSALDVDLELGNKFQQIITHQQQSLEKLGIPLFRVTSDKELMMKQKKILSILVEMLP